MHWSLIVLVGALLNVAVNFGYKTAVAKGDIFLMTAGVMLVACISLVALSLSTKGALKLSYVLTGWTPTIIVAMGVGTVGVLYLMITALSKGPFTLVDPLWACIYSLASGAVGMIMIREAPSTPALVGVGLYLLGAFLMARG